MQHWRVTTILFSLAVALVGVVGAMSYRNLLVLLDTRESVVRTTEVLAALSRVQASLQDAETGQRGYLLTGRNEYLEPYKAAVAGIGGALDELERRVRANPLQQASMARLRPAVAVKLDELGETVALQMQGRGEDAARLVATDRGRLLMTEVRSILAVMHTQAEHVLAEREERQRSAGRLALALVAGANLIGLGVAIGAFVNVRAQLRSRIRAESALDDANRRLAAANAELTRSNRDLQEFAYVASHDLQEPLRKIQAFGDRLTSKYRDQLAPEAADYVTRMGSAAGRMQMLITDLLNYSRTSVAPRSLERVDLNQIVAGALHDLEQRIAQSGGTVEVGLLPEVEADPLHMHQLMLNLIGNALKFARPGVAPRVAVRAEPAPGDAWRVTVSDNGLGFDEKYLDRIFKPFQRLHPRSAYEGTGMGLAVCRRIVERHGGSLSASSRPQEGSVFTIIWPSASAAVGSPVHETA